MPALRSQLFLKVDGFKTGPCIMFLFIILIIVPIPFPVPQFQVAHLGRRRRRKRSINNAHPELSGLQSHLGLSQSPRFLDPQFLLVRRWGNKTDVVVEHNEDPDECYYRSPNAALYFCDDVVSYHNNLHNIAPDQKTEKI